MTAIRFFSSTVAIILAFLSKDDVDSRSKSCSANKFAKELKKLISISQQNLLHTQKLKYRVYNKGVSIIAIHQTRKFGLMQIHQDRARSKT